jgi:hypothetical protein
LDTRTKIVEPHSIPRGRPVKVVVCYADPLWAGQVVALREQAGSGALLVVALDDPPQPLLPLGARAELVASLAFVDYVIADPAAAIPDAQVVDLREPDLGTRQALVERVLGRHGSE